ncbi:Hsp20/alpha crystallin family protein [Tautonia sociabilis]|uniref:Hsp20/alpha crystallin family protein n=1 Tax=Tautonia sociabilis TaxID=2080755 RepID=A0A432MFN0_9BACT|nr:Hsp20/alpha crystallin family protein [Tautonia sociabilis]RUL84939.1 Hsp20/alpha crystallin family protein [Tautonia sociabilis]
MAIERWDPFREMVSLRDAFNTLLQESFVRPDSLSRGEAAALPMPLDISETAEAFVVRASLPGIKPEDVQISVHGDTLTIQGETKSQEERQGETWHLRERRHGVFRRTVTLSVPVDADRASAEHENGVLTLTLPKAESARPKQIKVASASSK